MLNTLERSVATFDQLTNLGYVNPDFMLRFTFDRRVGYGNTVLELDKGDDPRFANLNIFVEPRSSEASFRRLVLINPARYSTEQHAKEGFEEYGVFPAGEHPCEGIMATIDIQTDAVEGYPAKLVLPQRGVLQTNAMIEYVGQGFDRHSQYCRSHRLTRLTDEHLVLEDPWQKYIALQKEHALALIHSPQAFRNAPILKMNVGM